MVFTLAEGPTILFDKLFCHVILKTHKQTWSWCTKWRPESVLTKDFKWTQVLHKLYSPKCPNKAQHQIWKMSRWASRERTHTRCIFSYPLCHLSSFVPVSCTFIHVPLCPSCSFTHIICFCSIQSCFHYLISINSLYFSFVHVDLF